MRDLSNVNQYQQLILSALALVHEEDIVAIFRALRAEPERNECIDLMNDELDRGRSLMEAFGESSALYAFFEDGFPDFNVTVVTNKIIELEFGTNASRGAIQRCGATMASTGVVEKLEPVFSSCEDGYTGAGELHITIYPLDADFSLN